MVQKLSHPGDESNLAVGAEIRDKLGSTMKSLPRLHWVALLSAAMIGSVFAESTPKTSPADHALAEYFQAETAELAAHCLENFPGRHDWECRRDALRQQLFEMLSLSPLPPRTDLKPVVTGKIERDDFVVENLHFQSMPGLYVTANLYRPKQVTRPAPTILYVCGHSPVISNGVSYGNKAAYQHHGAWFARNGYICLVIDTLQLGEIPGLHHGTYKEGQWWWNARGYSPAGVEAWNSIRALDYLATRPEVNTNRFGVTGRSGGGAYSWWLAALDERIKVAAPVAGITDLQNHVVDGTVEGHCDCMFMVNTYRWDYPQVAALVAPRPLLIANSDADSIFPLDGVVRLHGQTRSIYDLYNATDKLGLLITQGPHKDTQDLQLPVFRWFNRHLKGEDTVIEMAATNFFSPEQLKVFATLPADAINTNVQATFVPLAKAPVAPTSRKQWERRRDDWMLALKRLTFHGWPAEPPLLDLEHKFSAMHNGLRFQAFDFTSQTHVRLRLYLVSRSDSSRTERVVLNIVDPAAYEQWINTMAQGFNKELAEELQTVALTGQSSDAAKEHFKELRQKIRSNRMMMAYVAPRGIGLSAWNPDPKKQTQIRRRFMLLGQTLDGMRVWDIRRAVQALRATPEGREAAVSLQADGDLACDALYASLFEPNIAGLDLAQLPASHMAGPDLLNVLRVLDVPQAVAMAAEHSHVRLHRTDPLAWTFSAATAKNLNWGNRLEFVAR